MWPWKKKTPQPCVATIGSADEARSITDAAIEKAVGESDVTCALAAIGKAAAASESQIYLYLSTAQAKKLESIGFKLVFDHFYGTYAVGW